MNYVKSCLIITMLLGVGYSQCDANGDGDLNVIDVVIEVDCILTPGCWDGSDTTDVYVDIDGNVYETIQIGEQLWMAENLKVTHYNNGDEIQYVQQSSEPDVWENLSTGAYGYYDDDSSHLDTYGNLYNWYAVVIGGGLCMEGWHVPSDEEFMVLEMELGMSEQEANSYAEYRGTDEGSKLAGNSDLWPDGDLVNNSEFGTSGLNVLPAGYRSNFGYYISMGTIGKFWSSPDEHWINSTAWDRSLYYTYSGVGRNNPSRHYGFSIRCLKD